jgi:hypothetical protein
MYHVVLLREFEALVIILRNELQKISVNLYMHTCETDLAVLLVPQHVSFHALDTVWSHAAHAHHHPETLVCSQAVYQRVVSREKLNQAV